MRIGVIGSQGFIGRYLCKSLLESELVELYQWKRSIDGDFLKEVDREQFLSRNFDLVFQLAWTNVEQPNYRNHEQNELYAIASIRFAMSCHLKGVKLVILGSTITDDLSTTDRYVESKRLLENRIRTLSSPYVSLVKPTVVFSIQDRRPHLVRQFISWIENGNSADEFIIKTPSVWLDIIEVRDLARSLFQIGISEMSGGIFVVTSGLRLTVSEFVKQLRNQLGDNQTEFLPNISIEQSGQLADSMLFNSSAETLAFFQKK